MNDEHAVTGRAIASATPTANGPIIWKSPVSACPKNRMPKLARRLLLVVGAVVLALLFTACGLYWASRQVPEFYEQHLVLEPRAEAADDFEQQALALHNQLQHRGRWEARFTDEQINAWLATELPEKFPTLLPAAISEPRIALEDNLVRLAARYHRGSVDSVISLAGNVYLTDQPNELAIRISHARAGYLPLPLLQFLDDIRERAERADVSLRWTEVGGDPVALIRIPDQLPGDDCRDCDPERLLLDEVTLQAGEFVISGRLEIDNAKGEVSAVTAEPVVAAPR